MAYDKIIDSAAMKAKLVAVADVIRAKVGGDKKLSLPDGMIEAINSIQTGGAQEPYIEYTYVHPSGSWQYIETATLHGYTRIAAYSFFNQLRMTTVNGTDGVTAIDGGAFYGCSKLALTELPSSITVIDYEAFRNCAALALTSLPAGVTAIGSSAFRGCTSLTEITFEGTPKTISADAFNGCTNLLTINVPWAEGAVANAPWGATNATINYNYVAD